MSLNPDTRTGRFFGLLLLLTLLLAACGNSEEGGAETAPTPTLIPDSFVVLTAPAADAALSLATYNQDAAVTAPRRAAIGLPDYAYRSQVCAGLQLDTLVQPNDRLFSQDIDERLTLSINDEERPLAAEATQYGGVYGRVEIDNIEFEGGLNVFCWSTNLEVGVHAVELQFRQTDGAVQSFTWTFTITA